MVFFVDSKAQTLDFHRSDTTNSGQKHPIFKHVSFRPQYGLHFPTGVDELEESVERNPFIALDFRYGVQGYGYRKWHQFFKYPTYGIGYYQAIFTPADNTLGNPSAVYMYFNAPFKRWEKSSFNYDVSVGLAYNFLNYDPESNPNQTAIGSEANVHFAATLEYAFALSENWDGGVGVNVTHFSNGRSRTPNKGVNLLSLTARFSYKLDPKLWKGEKLAGQSKNPELIRHEIPDFHKRWSYAVVLSGGVTTSVDSIQDRNLYYGAASGTFDVYRHYGYTGKLAAGVDWFYDGSLAEEYASEYNGKVNVPSSMLHYFGIHLGHELLVHRWTLITDLGLALPEPEGRGSWFARVGLKYDFTEHLFGKIALKTPGGFIADFIEWGVGWNFTNRKQM